MLSPNALSALDDPTVALVFRVTGSGVWTWDTQTDQIRVTDPVAELLRYAPDAFPSDLTGFLDLVHPGDVAAVRKIVQAHRDGAGSFLVECACRLGDGSGWRRLRIRGHRTAQTSVAVGMAEDLTSVDLQTAELRHNERRLREAQRLAKVGSWEFETATGPIFWSDETYALFGVDPANGPPSYAAYLALIPLDDQPHLTAAIDAAFTAGTPYAFDQRIRRPDGSELWLHAVGDPLRDADGRIIGLSGTVADITDRKRTEAELMQLKDAAEAAMRTKAMFIANVSHELRTPMNGILGMLSLLLESSLQPAQKQYAWTAHSAAESLLSLLNDLLDFSKIEAGKLELQTVAFAPRDTLQNTVQLWQGRAQSKGIALAAAVDPDVPEVLRSDSVRMRQIILNLVSNAVKFTARGHVIVRMDVAAQDEESVTIRVSVTDSGPGITPDDLTKLFQPFTQLQQPDGVTPGTGLGLSISKRLVSLLGGEIGITSEVGRGSTFWFTARCFRTSNTTVPRHLQGAALDGIQIASGKRLLVVEDHPVNRLVALRLLERTGAVIDIATTGAEAISAVARQRYDLILMDCQMPEMNGLDASRAIRRLEAERLAPRVPIVAMTANAMTEDRERCLEAGMDDHVAKPIDRVLLYEAVHRWTAADAPAPGSGLIEEPVAMQVDAPTAGTEPEQLMASTGTNTAEFITTARPFVHDLANAVQAEDSVRLAESADWLRQLSVASGHATMTRLVDGIIAAPRAHDEDWYGLISGVRQIQAEMERLRVSVS